MVATRRQVQAAPDDSAISEQNPDLILRKKPVRKATAKAASNAKTVKAETNGKSTRSKKVDVMEELEASEAEAAPLKKKAGRPKPAAAEEAAEARAEVVGNEAKVTRATKTGSIRSKRGVPIVDEVEPEPPAAEKKATRATKAGSVRGRKAGPMVENEPSIEVAKPVDASRADSVRSRKPAAKAEAPSLPAPVEPKPARRTRGTAPKPQPLSPKKITQVSKPQTRNTKTTKQKPAAKAAQMKAANVRSTRKRAVSDENADVAEFTSLSNDVNEEDDVVMLSSTPKKAAPAAVSKVQPQTSAVNDSDITMSSRPTTPTDSVGQSLNTVDEQDEENVESEEELSEEDAEADAEEQEEANGSEDELCGPKTPMKRSSPRAYERYQSSVQRTAKKYENDVRMETPARRFVVLGSQEGTPQTLKPYRQPVAPSSATGPLTVARGMDRAFVFKDLRDGRPGTRKNVEAGDEQDEVSFLPDEHIIPIDTTPTPEEPIYLDSGTESSLDVEVHGGSLLVEDEDAFVAPMDLQKSSDDPDETVVVHDIEDEAQTSMSEQNESFQTEDTVLIDRVGHAALDESMTDDGSESQSDSVIVQPREALEHSVPQTPTRTPARALIAVNFDDHLVDARPVSRDADESMFDIGGEIAAGTPTEELHDAVAGAEMEFDSTENVQSIEFEAPVASSTTDVEMAEEHAQEPAQYTVTHAEDNPEQVHPATPTESRRQTMNFNEFFDVAALTEPTAELNLEDLIPHLEESKAPEALEALEASSVKLVEPAQKSEYRAELTIQGSVSLPQTEDADAGAEVDDDTDPSVLEDDTCKDEGAHLMHEEQVPHYALPTIAFDARRKSLPAISQRTPMKSSTRPSTSDGASMPRIANPFANAWWNRSGPNSTAATSIKARPSTSHATPSRSTFGTPVKSRLSSTPVATPKERYPLLSRQNYDRHANTVAAPARFGTPAQKSPKRRETFHRAVKGATITKADKSEVSTPVHSATATPKERFPALRSRANYEDHAKTVAAPVRFQTPAARSPTRRQTFHKAAGGKVNTPKVESEVATPAQTMAVTPQPASTERYPRLRPRRDYEEHAKTVAGPVRFQTPVKTTPLKRPRTAAKPDSLRKAALTGSASTLSQTPTKTPLKDTAMTPSQAPMTPHPAAPLRGITALVEVFTLEGASASAPFIALLHRLGAKTARSWNDRITHVIFKDGSPLTLQRVRLNNREVEQSGKGTLVHCVNSRWVTDCEAEGARVEESGEEYVVDVSEVPRGGKRRRKSMEPAALLNLGGNIVRDRKSSLGRKSLSRSPWKVDSAGKKVDEIPVATPEVEMVGKENSAEQSSPATPAWIAAPGQLVQQTAPMKRVRKLELPGIEAKNRRLTFWNGGS